jgi:hypothetical protein
MLTSDFELSKPGMKRETSAVWIACNSGHGVLIDADMEEKVRQYRWGVTFYNSSFYARGYISGKAVYLHRFVMGECDPKILIDHINGDTLNCCR